MLKKISSLLTSAYTLTLLTSVVSLLTSAILSGVFARIFSNDDYLQYHLLTRYFGFFQAILCGMIGFGVIHVLKKESGIISKIITNFSFFYLCFYLIILGIVYLFFTNDGLLFNIFHPSIFFIGSLWFLGQSFKHLFNFILRGNNQFNAANIYSLSINIGVIGLCILLTWHFSLAFYEYQFLVGLFAIIVSIVVIFFIKDLNWSRPKLDKQLIQSILKFSVSRWLENIFRYLFIVGLIFYLGYLGEQKIAGYIALLFTLIKMSESALQAFITVLFSKSANMGYSQLKRQFIIQTLVALSFSIGIMGLFWLFGTSIIHLWLGQQYLFLTEYFQILSLGVFAVITTLVFKGILENFFVHSPLMLLNGLMLFSLLFIPYFDSTLANLTWFIVIVFWVRFLVYLGVALKKLNSTKKPLIQLGIKERKINKPPN